MPDVFFHTGLKITLSISLFFIVFATTIKSLIDIIPTIIYQSLYHF